MAERKATNKYYPPDWDPSKGSINQHKKSHPLRHRARKIAEGILVVRFEMPYDIWCSGCNNHIGTGVRYNAEKTKVGNYYTSPIYRFRMKCHLCDNHFEIQTDPSKFEYVILSGARKQVKLPDSSIDEADRIVFDEEERKRRTADAMYRLEKKVTDKIESEASLPGLNELKEWRSRWADSFSANQLLRKQYREKRKKIEHKKAKDRKLLMKTSLKIPLVKSNSKDLELARELFKQSKCDQYKASEKLERHKLLSTITTSQVIPKEETDEARQQVPSSSKKVKSDRKHNAHTVRIKLEPS